MTASKTIVFITIILNALLWQARCQNEAESDTERVVISQRADRKSGISKRTILIGNKVCGKKGFVDKNNGESAGNSATKRQQIDLDSLHRDLHPEQAKDEVLSPPNVIKDEEHAPAVVVSKASTGPGWFARLNRCCIDHENCDKFIPAKSDKFGFKNDKEYTIYDCKCDDGFSECLKYADSHTADAVGDLYFNVLKMPCINFGDGGANITATDEQLMEKVDRLVNERLKMKEKNNGENENGTDEQNKEKEKPDENEGKEQRSSFGNTYSDPFEREARRFNGKNH